jgi:hypothetical protein
MAVKKITNDAFKYLSEALAREESNIGHGYGVSSDDGVVPKPGLELSFKMYLDRQREITARVATWRAWLENRAWWDFVKVQPVRYLNWGIFYQNCLFKVSGTHTEDEQKLLVLEFCDKERQKFERLSAKFNSEASREIKRDRETILEEVRIAVWRRDQGKCARCGSRESLEYDHIVPVSKGGSNTVRNVELLCENCNRQKGDRIQ